MDLDSILFFILLLIVAAFVLLAVLGLNSAINWLSKRAMQTRAAKAKDIAQHSVTVEVD
ncbi:MAG: hypothetical protein JOZ57_07220 [Abitibacteriaceae bacterium]|nr:hypothetical protein [Abditibacteriaceae bacterium]